jgi:hypothetical protein
MAALNPSRSDAFWRDGYLMVEDAVTPAQLAALGPRSRLGRAEPRHAAPFGPPTIDGRPRFDMGASNTAEQSRRCGASTTRRTFPTPIARSCSTRARSTWWPT